MRRIALWAVASVLMPVAAAAYPIPREGSEVGVDWSKPLLETGRWEKTGTRLRHIPSDHRRSFVISSTASRSFVRLRVHGSGSADVAVAIMFRTSVASRSPLKLEGYGLALSTNKRTLSFLRWDKTGRQDPGARIEIPTLAEVEELEVLLWMAGANFSATVVDAFSKEPLATLSWSDPSYTKGNLGLFAFERTGPGVELELWTQAELAKASKTPTAIAKRWMVILSPEQALGIPGRLLPLYRRADMPSASGVVMVTDERGLYLLREHGIEPESVQPGVPFAVSRMPNEELYDPSGVEAALRDLNRRFGRVTRLFEIGRSAEDRPIWALRIGPDPADRPRPTLLLSSGQHGNEASTPSYVIDAATYLLENRREPVVKDWLSAMTLVAVPMTNPDGSHAFWHTDATFGRKNRRPVVAGLRNPGVDLNRNFPFEWGGPASRYNSDDPASNFYYGPAPGSEPEVQAMMTLAGRERFVGMISYHSAATRLIVPYTVGGRQNPEPSAAWVMAEEMIAGLPYTFGRRRYEAVGALYPVRGVEKDWHHHTYGTMAFLLEVPFRRPRGPRLTEGIEFSRPAWFYLFERWLNGPSLAVRAVGGAERAPLEAVVTIDEIELRAGERWTTNPRTGWLYHYLPAVGRYTVTVERSGRRVSRRVEVGPGVTRVILTLGDLNAGHDVAEVPADAVGQ